MSSFELRKRSVWQNDAGLQAEKRFVEAFVSEFNGTEFRLRSKPKDFKNLYRDVSLPESTLSEIYTPEKSIIKHGMEPDFAIDNLITGRSIYGDVKRQDGWIEGGDRSDGRGNAHERGCKYFAPSISKALRDQGNLSEETLPFWLVFLGDITRDPCRVRELTFMFSGNEGHLFMWRNPADIRPLIDHFNNNLKHLLTGEPKPIETISKSSLRGCLSDIVSF